MRIEDIEISLIDIAKDRRVVSQAWAETIAADMIANGQLDEIEVVEAGGRFRLIDGAHRIDARIIRGEMFVRAKVLTADEVRTDAAAKLREIARNIMRRGHSVLDKSCDVSRWREVFEQANGAVKAGRVKNRGKYAPNSDEELEAQSELFAGSFNQAAQSALGLNKDAIKRYLRIARIDDQVRRSISLLKLADNQAELLLLAAQTPERQLSIANLLTSNPPATSTVTDAIAMLDHVPKTEPPAPWARVSDSFQKLPEAAKRRVIEENWDFIEAMLAERKAA